MNKIKAFPFHTFFIGIYFVWYIYVQNILQVTFPMIYRSLLVCFVLSVLLFAISFLIFKNKYKAGTFSTLLLVGLLTYGAFYNEFEKFYNDGLFPFSNIHRYAFALYVFLFVWLFIAVYKSRSTFVVSNKILNLFLIIVLTINCFAVARYSMLHSTVYTNSNNPFVTKHKVHEDGVTYEAPGPNAPDVYYIILDGYGSGNVLKKYFNFDNKSFSDFLINKGFFIADSSQTFYPYTALSLGSSLNLNYIDSTYFSASNTNQNLISQNFLSYYFKKNKYRVVNVESGYAITKKFDFADETIQLKGINEFERSLMQLSILRLDDILGISTYFSLKGVIELLPLASKGISPKFVFIHIVAPHPPYVFNRDGSFKFGKPAGHFSWEPRKDYIEQLIYVNTEVKKLICRITADTKRRPVIVVQSDHGPWIKDTSEANVFEARRGILNAYLAPKEWESSFTTKTSPVNSFRIILNKLFHADFPYLPVYEPDIKVFLRGSSYKINNQ